MGDARGADATVRRALDLEVIRVDLHVRLAHRRLRWPQVAPVVPLAGLLVGMRAIRSGHPLLRDPALLLLMERQLVLLVLRLLVEVVIPLPLLLVLHVLAARAAPALLLPLRGLLHGLLAHERRIPWRPRRRRPLPLLAHVAVPLLLHLPLHVQLTCLHQELETHLRLEVCEGELRIGLASRGLGSLGRGHSEGLLSLVHGEAGLRPARRRGGARI
mmetsp:Transcript_77934/g.252766  ORF Transcript_77934/g.252766 Transcript_77934/m.252766 type:complete len:216 (+) Transcript_77934:803-1450(+)